MKRSDGVAAHFDGGEGHDVEGRQHGDRIRRPHIGAHYVAGEEPRRVPVQDEQRAKGAPVAPPVAGLHPELQPDGLLRGIAAGPVGVGLRTFRSVGMELDPAIVARIADTVARHRLRDRQQQSVKPAGGQLAEQLCRLISVSCRSSADTIFARSWTLAAIEPDQIPPNTVGNAACNAHASATALRSVAPASKLGVDGGQRREKWGAERAHRAAHEGRVRADEQVAGRRVGNIAQHR